MMTGYVAVERGRGSVPEICRSMVAAKKSALAISTGDLSPGALASAAAHRSHGIGWHGRRHRLTRDDMHAPDGRRATTRKNRSLLRCLGRRRSVLGVDVA